MRMSFRVLAQEGPLPDAPRDSVAACCSFHVSGGWRGVGVRAPGPWGLSPAPLPGRWPWSCS